jgi:hypothetical protein
MHVCVCVCMYVCMYVCIYIYICIFLYAYNIIYVYMNPSSSIKYKCKSGAKLDIEQDGNIKDCVSARTCVCMREYACAVVVHAPTGASRHPAPFPTACADMVRCSCSCPTNRFPHHSPYPTLRQAVLCGKQRCCLPRT